MKIRVFILCLFPVMSLFAQEMVFSKDTLLINDSYYSDSLVIQNTGTELLRIDSIKCINWNYLLNVGFNSEHENSKVIDRFILPENIINILPGDSTLIIISPAAMVCSFYKMNYNWIDTMYFYSNSISQPVKELEIIDDISLGVEDIDELKTNYALYQNYPNPFNPTTVISFSLENPSYVRLSVYDCLGREIKVLVNGYCNSGKHTANFVGDELSSGIYYYQIVVGAARISKKMLLLK